MFILTNKNAVISGIILVASCMMASLAQADAPLIAEEHESAGLLEHAKNLALEDQTPEKEKDLKHQGKRIVLAEHFFEECFHSAHAARQEAKGVSEEKAAAREAFKTCVKALFPAKMARIKARMASK